MKLLLSLFFVLLSSVCLSQPGKQNDSPLTDKQKDSAIRNHAPIPDSAIVYIMRPTSFGAAIKMDVHYDSVLVGTTSANRYIYAILPPGSYTFRSKAENNSELLIELEAGRIYYIEQAVKMGILYARAHLNLVNDELGKKYMKKCKLAKEKKS